ncbi:putative dGTPase [Dictyocaulus viviparus]|uniref:Structural maintenance of chromosomes protein n=1 Tax=Dictyocaulus viviparus TaxID=29172 RepID=A0A0D8XZF1_DICVI|nr:putative dGTPase [Dictyocaulus viviparus]
MVRKKRVDSDDDSLISDEDDRSRRKPAKKRLPSPAGSPPGFKKKQAKPNTPAKVNRAVSKESKKAADQKKVPSSSDDENEFIEDYENEDLLRMVIPPRPQPCMKSDGSGARLVIREIVATNFKSYFGTQRIGPFHKNFTAIIGPNGSGKSNVIDSLLFVFGYKASKIRSKKLSVLIHSSRGHDDINSCTVEVFFEQIIDKDGVFSVVEGSEFSVSRTAYKNNNSVYAWNGKTMSIKEIAGRLRELGIDLVHNRFLILQGEVEQIAMMKPKGENTHEEGMLEYLEDIVGSSRFRIPIEKLSAKVETLKEQRTQALQRVRAADREKVALEAPVREMISYLKAENHAVLLRNQLLHIKLFQFIEKIDHVQPLRDAAFAKKADVEKALQDVLDAREADSDRLDAAQKEESCTRDLEKAVRDEIGALERSAKARANTIKRNVADIARVSDEIVKETQKLEELKGVPARAAARLEVLKSSIAELNDLERENIKKADENRDKFDRKARPEKAERARLEEEMGVLVLKEVDAKNKIHIAKEALKNMTHEETKLRKRLADFQNNLSVWKEDLEKRTSEMCELKVSLPHVQEELAQIRLSLPGTKEKEDKLMEEVNTLRAKISEDKQLVSSGIAGTERQKALAKAKSEGLLKGLIGRLGDLGTIDKKYDAAISTTTAALDSYVVETTNDGHEAIDYLVKVSISMDDEQNRTKLYAILLQRNLGRTNFIILDKTNEFKDSMDTAKKFPAPRLFDLIDIPDRRLRKVFYSTVFDTIVVDTLKEATDLSCKDRSLRIVTLLGQVVDSSGTVSGGGAPKYGLMGNKEKGKADQALREAQERLPALIKELDEKSEHLSETSKTCRQMEQRIFTLSNDANRLRTQYNACDNEILKLTERISHMEKQVVYVSEQLEKNLADEDEVAAKKAEIDAATSEKEECAKEVAAAKAKVDVVAAKVKSIFYEFVQKYLDEADTAKKRRQEIEEQAVKERVSIDLNEHNMEKVRNRIKFLEKSLSEKKAKEQRLLEEEEDLPKLLTQARIRQSELKEKLDEIEQFLKNTRQRREDFNRDELKYLKEIKAIFFVFMRKMLINNHCCSQYDAWNFSFISQNICVHGCFFIQICTDELNEKEDQLKGLTTEVEKLKRQMENLTLHPTEDFDVIPKEVRIRPATDDTLVDSLLGNLSLVEKEKTKEKKGKKRDKKKADESDEDFLESPSGIVPKLTREDVATLDKEEIKFKLTNIEQKQLSTRTDINMHVINDYKEKLKKLEAEQSVLDAVKEAVEEHMAVLDNMRRDRLKEFMEGFECIGLGLKEMYQMITLGGDASLDLKDSMDPFSQGIQFMVRPPKKSWKQIENLSGGEKTLASLSLVFALHHYRALHILRCAEKFHSFKCQHLCMLWMRSTPPLTLEMSQSSRTILRQDRTKNAQFVIISLRNNMFELGDRLIGIYKTFDRTQNVVVDPPQVQSVQEECARKDQMVLSRSSSASDEDLMVDVINTNAKENAMSPELEEQI